MATTAPELTFQQHIADFLVHTHHYGTLEQHKITDTEHAIAEDHLWAFLQATQADAIRQLAMNYGSDARAEFFRTLRQALRRTPLWLLMRQNLAVRGIDFHLYYPQPRSNAATDGHAQNRDPASPFL